MSKGMIDKALENACDTKACVIGEDVLEQVPFFFSEQFDGALDAIVVCDPRTKAAAGNRVAALLKNAGVVVSEHVLEPGGKEIHADYRYAEEVRAAVHQAIENSNGRAIVPVAVGSGVVNDLTKLASGELGVPYMVCATAASVDGYSSFGAAIRSPEGAKKTYACPAPRVIVADLEVMRTAPKWMAASGFADLLAKVTAGADWILADELGAAEWHDRAWHTVQDGLRESIADPEGVAAMKKEPLVKFVEGLMLGGFAMQDMQSSRPASGAEHMFSHILEMRNHMYLGDNVPHGYEVRVHPHLITMRHVVKWGCTRTSCRSSTKRCWRSTTPNLMWTPASPHGRTGPPKRPSWIRSLKEHLSPKSAESPLRGSTWTKRAFAPGCQMLNVVGLSSRPVLSSRFFRPRRSRADSGPSVRPSIPKRSVRRVSNRSWTS